MSLKMWSCLTILIIYTSSSLCEDTPVKKEEEPVKYVKPEAGGGTHIAEPFHDEQDFLSRWTVSKAKKDGMDESISKYDGIWKVESPTENPIEGDLGLILKSEAKHAAISSSLPAKFEFDANPLFVQYEVRFQKPLDCGGAYIKLLAESTTLDLNTFGDKTLYSIMFGPDKCGHEGKIHFIIQHENPVSGKMEENHAKAPSGEFSKMFDDKKTHLMTLIVRPGNTFDILLDKTIINTGSLLTDLEPPINPAKEIDDPTDEKPKDWDEREKIPDADATKPDDWDEDAPKQITDEAAVKPAEWLDDEPDQVPDPESIKPADWDTEEDGEWEAPLITNPKCADAGCGEWKPPIIDNPAYKGKWIPPLIVNPAYKGVWTPKKIANPNYFEDKNPFVNIKPIAAIGFELWSMQSDIVFDNIILASDQATINRWTAQTWDLKRTTEVADEKGAAASMMETMRKATEDMPWLWAIYIIVIILPFVLIYVLCFPSKDKTSQRKKTDEPCPDDVEEVAEDDVSNRSVESSAEEDIPEVEVVNDGITTKVTEEVEQMEVKAQQSEKEVQQVSDKPEHESVQEEKTNEHMKDHEEKVENEPENLSTNEHMKDHKKGENEPENLSTNEHLEDHKEKVDKEQEISSTNEHVEDHKEKVDKEQEISSEIEADRVHEHSDSQEEDEAVLESSPRATRSKKKTRKDT